MSIVYEKPPIMDTPVEGIPEQQYHSIRQRLVMFFRMNACWDPESLADEVVYRALRRINEGVPLDCSLSSYCLGIARNVLREFRKRPRDEEIQLEPSDNSAGSFGNLNHVEAMIFLNDCLTPLSVDQRYLWLEYHLGDRQKLADGRGQSRNALRIQIHRITSRILEHLNVARKERP